MEVYEITGFQTGVSKAGVNFLQPSDSYQNLSNGYVYRQVLQSRQGSELFCARLAGNTRVFGIFEHTLPDSSKELLAFDQNFLYKYNTATGNFDQIPFGGSMAAYAGFNISGKDKYIAGTSYPAAPLLSGGGANPAFTAGNQGARFVFTGDAIAVNGAGSAIFFYNGTDVQDFTSVVDNPNYAAPPQGPLIRASYVLWFNERINFIYPIINSLDYPQGILYSGIRSSSGNGDKFTVAGSGLLQADTYETITGAQIFGQVLSIQFDRSNWVAEKTRDAFNPYFIRKIPSVLGCNAKYSSVAWNDSIKSVGKTGIITTNGRQSVRCDDKIPYFTTDDVDQLLFNLTYGGFDRINGQFLWSYKISETDSTTQNSVLVQNYEEDSWSVYDQRFSVFGQTDLGLNLTWDDIEGPANEPWATWDTTEDIWNEIGLGLAVQKTLAGDDLGFIYDINKDFDDYFSNISAITAGATTTLTISASGYLAGDQVTISNVEGMTQINNFDENTNTYTNKLYNVLSATPTSIEIEEDSTNFTPYTTGGSVSKPISFYAETIPFNPFRNVGRRCYISHIEFLIDTNGAWIYVDVYADEETTPYKANILCRPTTSSTKAREWITVSVDNECNFHTIVMKQISPATQVKITSLRIHCAPGGLTSG